MTYEKYKAWITDNKFINSYYRWWLPKRSDTPEKFRAFRYRLGRDESAPLSIHNGQYIAITYAGIVEIGNFEKILLKNVTFETIIELYDINFNNVVLNRIGKKDYGNFNDAIKALSQSKTYIGFVFESKNMSFFKELDKYYYEKLP